jgi:hypothetical protein
MHTEETKLKISMSKKGKPSKLKGKHISEATKKKMSLSKTGLTIPFNIRQKISKTNTGRKLTTQQKLNRSRRGVQHHFYGKHRSAEVKNKLRQAALNHIEQYGYTSIGKHEKQLLDLQEQKDNCKLLRQVQIKGVGYIVDGYCIETNTVYEVYEKFHDKQVFKDLDRETEICNYLSCDFIILWDK